MYKPLGTYVLVEPIIRDRTALGLSIVSSERPLEMTVLAVADKVEGVSVGDVVLVEKWAGKEVVVNGKKCYFVNETELLVVIETV